MAQVLQPADALYVRHELHDVLRDNEAAEGLYAKLEVAEDKDWRNDCEQAVQHMQWEFRVN